MSNRYLYIDSRSRNVGSSISSSLFLLQSKITKIKRLRVKSISFANTFHNISSQNNRLSTSSGDVIMPPGHYTGAVFVATLDALLNGVFGAGNYATFVSTTNEIEWTLGTNTIYQSEMSNVLGVNETSLTGNNIKSTLYLATPSHVSIMCKQLSNDQHIFTSQNHENFNPLISIPIETPYLSVETTSYDNGPLNWIEYGSQISISKLTFKLCDSFSKRELKEASHWSLILEIQ